MRYIGLTGGIGSGKSTVAQFFKDLGVPVYISDSRAKSLMEESEELKRDIKELLGEEAYRGDRLNKTYISGRVFNDKSLLNQLNERVHPAVRKDFKRWAAQQKAPYVVQEAAIIFEIGSQDFYDKVILVTAPESLRIERIMRRDSNHTKKEIKSRMRNQWSDSQKITGSDYHIENLDLAATELQVLRIHEDLLGAG